MIKFITTEHFQEVTFGRVEENQFFVDEDGCLMQKMHDSGAIRIAYRDGKPCGDDGYSFDEDTVIKKILPHVTKIEF